jgi:hypothetical protein
MEGKAIIGGLIVIFVLFILGSALLPTVKSSGDTLQTSIGGSTGKLFGSSGAGIIVPIIGIAFLLAVLASILGYKMGWFGGHK